MQDFKITPIDIEIDKPQIKSWEKDFCDTPGYELIYKFVLENGTILNLGELIETNYEHYHIGKDETKNIVVAKNNKNEIIGFIVFQVYNLTTKCPEMFIRYIAINPKFQHQGYGKEMLIKIFSEQKKYLGCNIQEVFCYVDQENFSSLNLFKDFGFSFEDNTSGNLLLGVAKMPAIEIAIEKNQFI